MSQRHFHPDSDPLCFDQRLARQSWCTGRQEASNHRFALMATGRQNHPLSANKSTMNYQRGVTSIEYALLATLIAIAIIVGVRATGEANKQSWINWTGKVIAAVEGALGP